MSDNEQTTVIPGISDDAPVEEIPALTEDKSVTAESNTPAEANEDQEMAAEESSQADDEVTAADEDLSVRTSESLDTGLIVSDEWVAGDDALATSNAGDEETADTPSIVDVATDEGVKEPEQSMDTAETSADADGAVKEEDIKLKVGNAEPDTDEQTANETANAVTEDSAETKDEDNEKSSSKEDQNESSSKSETSKRSKDAVKYWALVDKNRQDFASWTQLITVVDKEGKLEGLREVYDEFLLYYPFCYGYWKKLADFVASKVDDAAAEQVYEDAVVAVGLSIDLWVAYIEFYVNRSKPEADIRALFERALDTCGLEFKSDRLWDMYIDWEVKNGKFVNITQIYRRLLSTATKCYSTHYDNVKEHIEKHEPWLVLSAEELPEMRIRASELIATEMESGAEDKDIPPGIGTDDATDEDIFDMSEDNPELMTDKLKTAIKTVLYQEFADVVDGNEKEVKLRWQYEEPIKRPYFHSKPLDSAQLKNWRRYLDWEIANGGENRAIFLFERCVIACAQYEEFWLKYTSYLEGLGRHTDVRNVYTRACRQHLPYKAAIHITWAFYEERQGDYEQALAVISHIEQQTLDNMCVLNHKLNLLRRHGEDLCDLFTSYINKKTLSADSTKLLTSKYARYLLKVKGDPDKASAVLTKAISTHAMHEPFYTQLLDVEYQRQPLDEEKILAVFDLINASSLSAEVKQKFYSRRYEFIDDLGSDVNRLYSMYQQHEEAAAKEKKRVLASSEKSSLTESSSKKPRTTAYPNNGHTQGYQQQQTTPYQQQQQGYNYGGAAAADWSQYYQQQADYNNQYAYNQQYAGQQQGYNYGYDYNATGYY